MPNSINTNLSAINAQNKLNKTNKSTKSAMEKLSSGKRINSAKDDPAGLAIALRFAAQMAGANQAARNTNDGISLVQTTDGGLAAISDNLQRMRELAVQAANGTNSPSDLKALNLEYQQTQSSIEQTVKNADFNGIKVLNNDQNLNLQVGPNADPSTNQMTVNATNVMANPDVNTAVTQTDVTNQTNSTDAIAKIDAAIQQVSLERANLGATQNKLASTVSNLSSSYENTAAARSRIEDTDYAKQTAELARSQILNKAGLSSLAHANANASLVAGLLNKPF